MSAEEQEKFTSLLDSDKSQREAKGEVVGKKLREADEYEVTKLY
jgi:hypothetical protein